MITKVIPEQTSEVTLWQWMYSDETKQLTIVYFMNGSQYAHTFTEEETTNWTDDKTMIDLLCKKEWFIIS